MRQPPPILIILLFVGIFLLIDYYVFTGLRTLTSGFEPRTRKIVHWVYWGVNLSLFLWIGGLFLFMQSDAGVPRSVSTFFGFWLALFIPKLIFSVFLLGEDVYRLFRSAYAAGHNAIYDVDKMELGTSRRKFISTIAAATAAVPFLGIIHGIASGKFRYRVVRETVYFPDLPDAFDGFTITQLSDIHSGSFDPDSDREDIRRGIELANAQNSDLFVFTGDLVNNATREMEPWVDEFSKLRGTHGQFSILGNHDYGDYISWPSESAKEKNMEDMYAMHETLGFRLLRNEHHMLEKDGQQLYVVGVENWGTGGFKRNGDLDRALENIPKDAFKVLLSHDPSHFDEIVCRHETPIHLTLSGHTHGGQFGVEIPGIKLSPVQLRYPRWAGLYDDASRYIYVNRGFGFLAFPGRVGIWPEVTVITLKKGNAPSLA